MDDAAHRIAPTSVAAMLGGGGSPASVREPAALIQAVYASAPVGLSFVDTSLRCKALNQRMADLTGHSIEACIGHRPTEVYRDPAAGRLAEQVLQRVIDTGAPIEGVEYTVVTPNSGGAVRNLLVSYEPVRDTDGAMLGVSVAVNDVTERKRAEAWVSHLAQHDPLTNLPNRVLFRETLEHALAFARRGHLLALHCLDLDQFKELARIHWPIAELVKYS